MKVSSRIDQFCPNVFVTISIHLVRKKMILKNGHLIQERMLSQSPILLVMGQHSLL